jgi:eukaryotic-like serine/threonine-protein kinase
METLASRYRLEEKIGSGGEARIFRARDLETGDDVAVRLSLQDDSFGVALKVPAPHPGWVRLLDRGVDPQHGAFAVFELLRGETLGAMMTGGPLPHKAWLDFARQSLEAVEALHQAGWVHGDLNADNFFLHDGTTWKLLELPFHQAVPVEKRSPLFGSIYTLSPEQLAGRPPDARSDLYALGCLYYRAADGVYPHADGNAAQIAVGRLRFPATPLSGIARDFPGAWAGWVMHLIERNSVDRPVDAGAARQLLESAAKEA